MSFIKEYTVLARWGVGKRWHVVTLPLNYPTNPRSLILIIHLNPTAETLIAAREHVKLLNYCFQHKEKSTVVIIAVCLSLRLYALHLLTIRSQCNLTNTYRKFLCLPCVISVWVLESVSRSLCLSCIWSPWNATVWEWQQKRKYFCFAAINCHSVSCDLLILNRPSWDCRI